MDFETAFELLNDETRRAVVEILRDDSPISRRRLADRLATRGVEAHGNVERESAGSTRYGLRVALHYDHLPHLSDLGLVEYDDETVAATPELEAFAERFGPLDRDGRPPDDPEPTADDLEDRLAEFYA